MLANQNPKLLGLKLHLEKIPFTAVKIAVKSLFRFAGNGRFNVLQLKDISLEIFGKSVKKLNL